MIAIFDFDGTLTKYDTLMRVVYFFFRKGHVRVLAIFFLKMCLKCRLISLDRFKRISIKLLLKNRRVKEIDELFEAWFLNCKDSLMNKKTEAYVIDHLKNGDKVIIISANIFPLVKVAANYLNIKNIIATSLDVKGDKYTGNIVGDIIYGKVKAEKAKEKFGNQLKRAVSYADDNSDQWLMNEVETKVWIKN